MTQPPKRRRTGELASLHLKIGGMSCSFCANAIVAAAEAEAIAIPASRDFLATGGQGVEAVVEGHRSPR